MNTTVNDLLMSCPDGQIGRMQNAYMAAANGAWKEASRHLFNASLDGNSSWHDRCGILADEYEKKETK